jgi:lysophospholipase L1-like esterase
MTKFVKSIKFGKDGDIYVVKDSEAHAKIAALEAKVDSAEAPDVSGLATKEELQAVNTKVDAIEIPDISGLATKEELASANAKIDAIEIPDVSGLATKEELQAVEIPDVAGLATKAELEEAVANLATETSLTQLNETTTAAINEIKENYATNESVDAKISSVNTDFNDLFTVTETIENKILPKAVLTNNKLSTMAQLSNSSSTCGVFIPTNQVNMQGKVLYSLDMNWGQTGDMDVYIVNAGGNGIITQDMLPAFSAIATELKLLCKLHISKLGEYSIVLQESDEVTNINQDYVNEDGYIVIPNGHYVGLKGYSQANGAAFKYGGTDNIGFIYYLNGNKSKSDTCLAVGMSTLESTEVVLKDYTFDNYLVETSTVESVNYPATFDTTYNNSILPSHNAVKGMFFFPVVQQQSCNGKVITGISYYGNAGVTMKIGYHPWADNSVFTSGMDVAGWNAIMTGDDTPYILFEVTPTETTTTGKPVFYKLDGTDDRVNILNTEKYDAEAGGFPVDSTMALFVSDRNNITGATSVIAIGSTNNSSFFFKSGVTGYCGHINANNSKISSTTSGTLLINLHTTEKIVEEVKDIKSGVLKDVLGADIHKEESPLKGKYLSLIGDSITTFSGWSNVAPASPNGAIYYPYGAITNVEQTYWHKLVTRTGMNLLVNNSWSGSRCSNSGGGPVVSTSNDRCKQLHKNGINPDYILINIGTNDFNNDVELGTWNGRGEKFPVDTLAPTTFREAYAVMLHRLRKNYPLAKIYCCTIPCGNNKSDNFNEINAKGVSLVEYNDAIREIATAYGARVIELATSGLDYYTLNTLYVDGRLHPNEAGMERYYEIIRYAMENEDSTNVSCPRAAALMKGSIPEISKSSATTLEELITSYNTLLDTLQARGIIVATEASE